MKIHCDDYGVHVGEDVDVHKRLTITDPAYESKDDYWDCLAMHVE